FLSPAWGRASQLLSILFFLGVLALVFVVEIVFELVAAVGSIILLPAWALWLDRQLAGSQRAEPALR
ncbi:MAG TPA: hypothetical protein VFA25_05240, partial [Actinomycetota bacterium]|nr:hypothetical protein [Actinomycetota bacterium]